MRVQMILSLLLVMVLTACAELRTSSTTRDDYVEIANPAATLSPGAPATIWVPRESVETGAPRGSVLVQAGYDSVVNSIRKLPQSRPPQTVPDSMPDTYR